MVTTDPTQTLIKYLITRNKPDRERLQLNHFKNIRCNDNDNKSCIIPIYTPTDNIDTLPNDLIILTPNNKYCFFINDLYNVNYTALLSRLITRYKLTVRPYNIVL